MSLHDDLHAAVEARLALARAADGKPWQLEADGPVVAHWYANTPATIERHCLADLRRLERHQQATFGGAPLRSADECHCADAWPCPEIADLAEAYGIGGAP